ncbi:MAG: hypothetical protein ACO1NS_05705 [Daejeonella sp.]
MNNLNREQADKVLRTLYHLSANEMKEYLLVCEMNEIPAEQTESIFRYLDSREFLRIVGKVGNGDVYVQLSKIGFKFFAEDNLVDEHVRSFRDSFQPSATVFHNKGDASNFGNTNQGTGTNFSTHVDKRQPKEKKWLYKFLHDTSTQIVSALAAAAIIGLLGWYFSQ